MDHQNDTFSLLRNGALVNGVGRVAQPLDVVQRFRYDPCYGRMHRIHGIPDAMPPEIKPWTVGD